jgi:hypothetical protein
MIRRSIITTAGAAALSFGLVFAGAGAASAHECYVVNRSAQGTAAAAHSGNWYVLTVADLLAEAPMIFQMPELTEDQTAWALAEADAQGIPDSFALFTRFTLPKGGPAKLVTDSKGIDHFFAKYIDQLGEIYMTALTK